MIEWQAGSGVMLLVVWVRSGLLNICADHVSGSVAVWRGGIRFVDG